MILFYIDPWLQNPGDLIDPANSSSNSSSYSNPNYSSANSSSNSNPSSSYATYATTTNSTADAAKTGAIRVYGHRLPPSFSSLLSSSLSSSSGDHSSDPTSVDDRESYKSVMITVHNTCSQILPLVMDKWKMKDDWKKYALFMVFRGKGTATTMASGCAGVMTMMMMMMMMMTLILFLSLYVCSHCLSRSLAPSLCLNLPHTHCYHQIRTEKCLTYDDKPLALLLQLQQQSTNEVPVFVLRSIRSTGGSSMGFVAASDQARRSAAAEMDLHESRKSHVLWASMVGALYGGATSTVATSSSSSSSVDNHTLAPRGDNDDVVGGGGDGNDDGNVDGDTAAQHPESAVAIYEYTAEREDELDVHIGDQFLIRDKNAAGWWVVERDGCTGWVPAGCLMEMSSAAVSAGASDPLSTGAAVAGAAAGGAHATDAQGGVGGDNPLAGNAEGDPPVQKGVALYDYDAVGGNELSIKKDDVLLVLRKFQHWLLAENQGAQGWVPSCYVSVQNGGTNEYTPAASPSPARILLTADHDDGDDGHDHDHDDYDGHEVAEVVDEATPEAPAVTVTSDVDKVSRFSLEFLLPLLLLAVEVS